MGWETKVFQITEMGEAKEWVMDHDLKWFTIDDRIKEIDVPTEEILMKDFLNEHFCYEEIS